MFVLISLIIHLKVLYKRRGDKAVPLLQTGTVSLYEVIETCGNNI